MLRLRLPRFGVWPPGALPARLLLDMRRQHVPLHHVRGGSGVAACRGEDVGRSAAAPHGRVSGCLAWPLLPAVSSTRRSAHPSPGCPDPARVTSPRTCALPVPPHAAAAPPSPSWSASRGRRASTSRRSRCRWVAQRWAGQRGAGGLRRAMPCCCWRCRHSLRPSWPAPTVVLAHE